MLKKNHCSMITVFNSSRLSVVLFMIGIGVVVSTWLQNPIKARSPIVVMRRNPVGQGIMTIFIAFSLIKLLAPNQSASASKSTFELPLCLLLFGS